MSKIKCINPSQFRIAKNAEISLMLAGGEPVRNQPVLYLFKKIVLW